jgi:excisionase family DNA binding protein
MPCGVWGETEEARSVLDPREVAYLLEVSPRAVRNMLRRGELAVFWAGRLRRVRASDVARRLSDSPLALATMDAILAEQLTVPRVPFDGPPSSLIENSKALW